MARRWHLYRACEPKGGAGTAALLVATFVGLAVATRLFSLDQQGNSAFWPANAAVVVALLVLPPGLGWLTCVFCFAANVLVNVATSYMPADNLAFSSLNMGVSVLAAFLTRSLCGATVDLTRIRRLTTFAGIAFLSAGLEAAVGDLWLRDWLTRAALDDWFQWTLCDGLGLLLATPAILLAVRTPEPDLACDAGVVERVALLGATLALDVAAFRVTGFPLILLVYPMLILTAFRAGSAWVLGSVLLTCLIASAMTVHGHGPLVALAHGSRLLKQDMVQPCLVSFFLAAVPANNALGEKNRAARRLRRLRAAMEDDALHDALTGLHNRKSFRRQLAGQAHAGAACTLLLVDLDRFKEVNDSHGHLAGDELLRAFSARLAGAAGEGAVVARLGGDEFAVLLESGPGLDRVDATCERILAAARLPFVLRSIVATVSVSVGGSLQISGQWSTDEAMREADIALYAAKADGRDGYRLYDTGLGQAARDAAELEVELRAALDGAGGLEVHYQPKFGRDGRPTGVEALLRWRHPRLGSIPPARFIAVAEQTALIHPLGAWVLREALGFARRWPCLSVAVNVSAVQLRHSGFVPATLAACRAAAPRRGQIELEVTETALLDGAYGSTQAISALRGAGLKVALDDFGTGCSSLSHLTRFEVDRLKIDRSFVMALADDRRAPAIVRNVIELGHALGMQVTAEGVETAAQRDFLLAAGVDELQGYFLAQPGNEAALALHLTDTMERQRA